MVAAYAIFYNITLIVATFIGGFYIYGRNVLNNLLGTQQF